MANNQGQSNSEKNLVNFFQNASFPNTDGQMESLLTESNMNYSNLMNHGGSMPVKHLSPRDTKSLSQNSYSASSSTAAAIASSIVAAANLGKQLNNQTSPIVKTNSIKLCRRRKARTVFSDQQLSGLEKRFETQKYLSTPERVELANDLGLSETQVNLKETKKKELKLKKAQ